MHEGSPSRRGSHMQGMRAYMVVMSVWGVCVCVLRGSVNEDARRRGRRHERSKSSCTPS